VGHININIDEAQNIRKIISTLNPRINRIISLVHSNPNSGEIKILLDQISSALNDISQKTKVPLDGQNHLAGAHNNLFALAEVLANGGKPTEKHKEHYEHYAAEIFKDLREFSNELPKRSFWSIFVFFKRH
jgi:hypothetical protein